MKDNWIKRIESETGEPIETTLERERDNAVAWGKTKTMLASELGISKNQLDKFCRKIGIKFRSGQSSPEGKASRRESAKRKMGRNFVCIDGKDMLLTEACELYGKSYSTVTRKARLSGVSLTEAFHMPIMSKEDRIAKSIHARWSGKKRTDSIFNKMGDL